MEHKSQKKYRSVDAFPIDEGSRGRWWDKNGAKHGAFYFRVNPHSGRCHLWVHLPYAAPGSRSHTWHCLRVYTGREGEDKPTDSTEPMWWWDGNEQAPTLRPSIAVPNAWHGFMTAGRLEACE